MSRSTLETALRNWIVDSTSGVTVIFANQGAPDPMSLFASVTLGNKATNGLPHKSSITDPGSPAYGTRTIGEDRRVFVNVQFFGEGAYDAAQSALNGLRKVEIQDDLQSANLAPVGSLPEVQDLTALVETDFEERASIDVEFLSIDTFTESVPIIETVEITATTEYPEDTSRDSLTIEVS